MALSRQHVRQIYNDLLNQSVNLEKFYESIAMLLESNPYFFQGYLEMLWRTEELRDREYFRKIMNYGYTKVIELLIQKKVRDQLIQYWTEYDKQALLEFLVRVKYSRMPLYKRLTAPLVNNILDNLIQIKNHTSPIEPKYLRCVETLDPTPLRDEINSLAPFWWQVYTARTMSITHHQHTRSILIRKLQNQDETYTPVEEGHESVPTPYAELLSKTHKTILGFAEKYRLGLGRVVVVKLNPWAQAYRHYDSEIYLRGRNRYHLVIEAGKNNILSSGFETIAAKPGEIWFFDNKVMHRAHNKSSMSRIHVIFDGYPLDRDK